MKKLKITGTQVDKSVVFPSIYKAENKRKANINKIFED
jgi:hypothetical protein